MLAVENISPYLIQGSNNPVLPRANSISDLPKMVRGSQPTDNGNLILSPAEKTEVLKESLSFEKVIKKYMGGDDFLNSKERYCLWIESGDLKLVEKSTIIKDRIIKCKDCLLYTSPSPRDRG